MKKQDFIKAVEMKLREDFEPSPYEGMTQKLQEAFPQWFGENGQYDARKLLWTLHEVYGTGRVDENTKRAAMAEVILERSSVNKAELGLTAPEGSDYEIERVFEGDTLNRAFMNAWDWASGNQYDVTFEGESKEDGNISDWTFSKDGSEQKLVRLK
jgi:hypothetical protein